MSKKQFSLQWCFEPFEEDCTFFSKCMFGGLAAYVHGKMVMVLVENSGDKVYRGKTYNIELWNGILLPTEREFHTEMKKKFNNLIGHPVLGKWLYLQMSDPDFENTVDKISHLISKDDPHFGIFPKVK